MSYIEKEIGERLIERIYERINNSRKRNKETIKEWKENGYPVNSLKGYERSYRSFKNDSGRNKRIGG